MNGGLRFLQARQVLTGSPVFSLTQRKRNMNLLQLVTDPYNRRARLKPALLAILPVVVVALILYPELETKLATVAGLVVYLGGAVWLTQVGRDRGKRLEPRLFAAWGGKPSMAMLRHRDDRLNAPTKRRYHAFLQAHVPHLSLPSPEEEALNPEKADEMYDAASGWLAARTRDVGTYRLLFEENMNYGFRRNYWALKWHAGGADLLVLLILAVIVADQWTGDWAAMAAGLDLKLWGAFAVPIAHLVLTLLVARMRWVETVANSYASQLLAACDIMHQTEQ